MRYLELALSPGEERIHPLFPVMADSEFIEGAWMLDWNITRHDTTMALFRLQGDRDALATILEAEDVVREYDFSVADDGFYVYIYSETLPVERELWLAFNQRRAVLIPPLEYRNGEVVCRIVGSDDEVRNALSEVPDGITVRIRRLSQFEGDHEGVRHQLTQRQQEAVEAGIDAGYYQVPREATAGDVADKINVDPSTASELLRRAEARIVTYLFDGPGSA